MVSKQTVTLANSIVGVSVLAMPFCFKQCGIVLATLMLILGAIITRTVCYFLLKAGTITRRRNYEMLAWHTFGQGGKFLVEITIIGFLFGTLIAFFVVMGDLGPEIVSEMFQVENNYSLRNIIMAALCLFVALPLGLLRNIDSLSPVSTASVLFYVFLVFKILSEGIGPLFSGSYLDKVDYWRPAGVLQCIPIFSMALSCQTQIFGIYESLPDPSLIKMNDIVKQAVIICTVFYFCVGFFGYIAFSHLNFGGNILMTFAPSGSTQLIKICFLMSIVFSVPLVVFPCRTSLHSLIFRRVQMHHSLHDISTNYIPDGRLKLLTIVIIGGGLITGILIPNIELVLGLVGSTTGTVICIIFPSIMFIRVTSKQTTERLLAQVIFFTGVVTMVVSTYATLYAAEQAQSQNQNQVNQAQAQADDKLHQNRVTEILKAAVRLESKPSFDAPLDNKIVANRNDLVASLQSQQEEPKKDLNLDVSKAPLPPQPANSANAKVPVAPPSSSNIKDDSKDRRVKIIEVEDKEKVQIQMHDNDNSELKNSKNQPPLQQDQQDEKQQPMKMAPQQDEQQQQMKMAPQQDENKVMKKERPSGNSDPGPDHVEVKVKTDKLLDVAEAKNQDKDQDANDNEKTSEIKKEAKVPVPVPIKSEKVEDEADKGKEANEAKSEAKSPLADKDAAENFLKTLKEHQENQKKLLEEQRQILAELKEHHEQDVQRQKQEFEAGTNANVQNQGRQGQGQGGKVGKV